MPPRTVVFDFDGTLADTLAVGLRASNTVAPEFGLREVGDEEVDALRTMSTRGTLRHLGVPFRKLPRLVQRVRREMNRQMPSVRLFDGVPECLDELHASGVELGVLTSNSHENVELCLRNNGVAGHVAFVRTSMHLFGKHHALRRLLADRRLDPATAMYVGDQDRDVEAAQRCGMSSIAACWGYQSRERLHDCRPDLLADTPADVARFVLSRQLPSPRRP